MIHASVEISDGALEKTLKLLGDFSDDRIPEKAITHALNRTAIGARAEIVRAITQKHEVRSRDVRDAIKIKKANYDTLAAEVHSTGSVIGLEDFRHSPIGFTLPRPKVGVKVRVRKDRPGGRIPGTFFMPSRKPIFARKDDRIVRKFGPAIPSMMRVVLDKEGEQGIQDRAEKRMVRELEHEIDFIILKGAK